MLTILSHTAPGQLQQLSLYCFILASIIKHQLFFIRFFTNNFFLCAEGWDTLLQSSSPPPTNVNGDVTNTTTPSLPLPPSCHQSAQLSLQKIQPNPHTLQELCILQTLSLSLHHGALALTGPHHHQVHLTGPQLRTPSWQG